MTINEDAFRKLAEEFGNMKSRIARLERIEQAKAFTGASGGAAGGLGYPAIPTAGQQNHVLHGDNTWRGQLDLTGYVKAAGEIYPYGDLRGIASRFVNRWGNTNITDHFRSGSLPSGFAWQGAPFATPSSVQNSFQSEYFAAADGSNLGFLADTGITTYLNKKFLARINVSQNCSLGIRFDDNSDNNYYQGYLTYASNGQGTFKTQQRTGGGAVTTTTAVTVFLSEFFTVLLSCVSGGAGHTDWFYIVNEAGEVAAIATGSNVSWAVSRVGLVLNADSASKGGFGFCDWIFSQFV